MTESISLANASHEASRPAKTESMIWRGKPILGKTRTVKVKREPSQLERWFRNLPIGRKQLLALIICELVPILGLGVGATLIITQGLRQQLLEQAKSEVAVTGIQYNIKIDQMGFGSRGQSDNSALIQAALDHNLQADINPTLADQVKTILRNETKARDIEYATLVGSDLRIIANSNRDRQGELFDPHKLVSNVLEQGIQIKASKTVPWSELEREKPSLPSGFANQDALIRYVVTPIYDPTEKTSVIGILVFGDIVNGKPVIAQRTLDEFDGGYSAVYQRQINGEYELTSSLQRDRGAVLTALESGLSLPSNQLLEAAVERQGDVVTRRVKIGDRTYTMAAKAEASQILELPQGKRLVYDNPSAILVRGTPETVLNAILHRSLLQEISVLFLSAGLISFWTFLFRRTVLNPILELENATQDFAEGNRNRRAEISAFDEIGQLGLTFNQMADNIVESEASLASEARRQKFQARSAQQLNEVTTQMRETFEVQFASNAAVRSIRQTLEADRVILYSLDELGQGKVEAESALPGFNSILGESITDICFAERYIDLYEKGRVHLISDLENSEIESCYREELERFQIRANLVVPVLVDNHLNGLLCVHQCSQPRLWQSSETSFVQQVAIQLGYAIQECQLFQQREKAIQSANLMSDEQRHQKESLQRQLIELLSNIESAADGDLTVRADVTAGEIGTVADFFNSIIENLRQIVTQVKASVLQVNHSVGENDREIRHLAEEALRQSDEISTAFQSIENMTRSIQLVAQNAGQAAEVTQVAASTAEAGGIAMDRTVDNILTLRETIGETAKKVKRLGESSQQITKIVYLINQISIQTNLLAINAGIEAARAGEQGQGFAAVAEEVGELAARASSATQEIEHLVEVIQRETGEVVEAMELGTAQVVEGTYLVEDVKQNLSQILVISQQIDQLVKSISDATVSQSEVSHSITSLMQELATIAQRTSASSLEVSSSLQQTVQVTEQLQASVNTFKVS